MVQRPLWTLPISSSLLNKLKDAGFEYCEDVLSETTSEEIKQILSDSKIDFTKLISIPPTQTALEMYKEEVDKEDNIVTFSKAIDDLFDGGIPTGKITELVGVPGCGKTQICLQLVVSIQIPSFLGGLNGSAVFIETNSNFSPKRIKEIYSSCSTHCVEVSKELSSSCETQNTTLQNFVERNPLNRITRFSAESVEELRGSILMTKLMLENSTNNVVITNELTTCVLDNGMTEIVTSLGESFAHVVHNRLMLGKHQRTNHYTALLHKSPEFPSDSAYFQIHQGGIRDVPAE